MRSFFPAAILVLTVAGCATLRGPVAEEGPALVIHNEGFAHLDLAYRCTENGPVTPLGSVQPQTVATFVLKPAFCSSVYLVSRPLGLQPLGLDRDGRRAFAVVQLNARGPTELVFTAAGVLLRKDSTTVARSEPQS
ncbi:hypothetical protein BH23GEM2_BH23GEM2_24890 [soil metagenome]